MSQKGFIPAPLILLVITLLVAFYLGRISVKNSTGQDNNPSPNPMFCGALGCWYDNPASANVKFGYGYLEGYYTTYQLKNSDGSTITCPGLKVRTLDPNYDPTFYNIAGTKRGDILTIELDKYPQYKQMIMDSTSNHPVTLSIFQPITYGHGIDSCGYADYIIYDVSLAR